MIETCSSPLRSRAEAAAFLGLAPNTLAVWACTKRVPLPFVRIGRLVKYRQADLDAFILSNLTAQEVF